ncbi:Histidine kinase-like ATPase domain-containing protein [Actinomadura meyerae]|uniref:Histidine kinase-like ATPase domain-containing protein n=1 Tax=Actinomadura meyerae TaxID=240840 RepID=A0A239IIE1_9ACTN|nr:sensor histidine kinase [Actinomadura meyerae]SNS93018.1 Histidine kinase-like ATPase domain-containing protein [Actinomadura meyerae]
MNDDFTHRVLPYDGVDDYLGGAVPFLRDGIAAGDRVLAVCGTAREMLLRDALGGAAEAVLFTDAAAWYAHPSRTLADCLGDAAESARRGRRLRLLGEPAWATRSPLEVVEWERAEALVNIALRGTGASVLCPYSTTLPAAVVAAGRKTHPETVRGTSARRNPGFVDPWTFCARCDADPLPPPPPGADTLPLDDRPDLFWLRAWITDCARQTPLPEEGLQRLLVAATEVVTNALRHGAPPVVLRIWADSGGEDSGGTGSGGVHSSGGDASLVCEVADAGRWAPGTGYGLLPPRPQGALADERFGLWAVRLLCSTVQIRTGENGTTVRLRFALPGRNGAG